MTFLQKQEKKKREKEKQFSNDIHSSFNIFKEGCSLPLAAEFSPITISQAIIPNNSKNEIMSLQEYYQFEQYSSLFDLSAGSIKNFNFFNIHSDQQDEEEFDGAKVIKKKTITTTWEYSFSNIFF